jgi:hypothetical protein
MAVVVTLGMAESVLRLGFRDVKTTAYGPKSNELMHLELKGLLEDGDE